MGEIKMTKDKVVKKYKLKDSNILKNGHTMFKEDIVKELDYIQQLQKKKEKKKIKYL